jgi:hypothetical protein
MPFEVPLSQIVDKAQFDQGVQAHIKALTDFNKVKGKPRPVAHPLIEQSIKRVSHPINQKKPDSFIANYTFKDDAVVQVLSLDDKKNRCVAQLRNAESDAKAKLVPQRKLRLHMLNVGAAGAKKNDDSVPEDLRTIKTEADKALLAHHAELNAKWTVIERQAAEAESAIEDLTDSTVDSWQVPQLG